MNDRSGDARYLCLTLIGTYEECGR